MEDFEKYLVEDDEVIKMEELEKNLIYEVKGFTPIETKYGPSYIVALEDEDGDEYQMWSTSLLTKKINLGKKFTHLKYTGKKTNKHGNVTFKFNLYLKESSK